MVVEEKNEGKKITYAVNDTVINFDSTLSINLARYQKDVENTIDICLDQDMQLGTGLKYRYAANIIIPAKTYTQVDTGKKDNEEHEIYNKIAEPLDMEKVRLILWALPANYIGGTN